ncbi:aldose 1-epimerase [Gordonia shandongensis]|uniref:aldose epimerase family protein n=1 Tax=Gordonia shandongensis TaxID=376351 RepID=UPI001FDED248|nr:aldose 1-epimerase [Gordonia shandongensis]
MAPTDDRAHDDTLALNTTDAQVRVCPGTGRLTSLRVGADELLRPGDDGGCFPMAPWCGRLGGGVLRVDGREFEFPRDDPPHALHGTVRDHPWRVVEHTPDRVLLTQRLEGRWPWAGDVVQDIRLRSDAVELGMTVRSDAHPFPAQVGWHPWFRRRLAAGDGDLRVHAAPAWQEERGDDYLPTGRRIDPQPPPWDDCFGMPDGVDVRLEWPGRRSLRIRSDARWVVIFDHPVDAICVEPQTGPPNGLATAPRTVRPGDPVTASTVWSWGPPDGAGAASQVPAQSSPLRLP